MQENGTINFTIVSYDFRGNLIEMRQLKLNDLNLCNRISSPANHWQQSFKFARNFLSTCTINLQEFIDLQPDTKFSSLYLNYFEKKLNVLETIPILIRNSFEVNEVSASKIVKRDSFKDKSSILARRHWKMAAGETILLNRHDLRSTNDVWW